MTAMDQCPAGVCSPTDMDAWPYSSATTAPTSPVSSAGTATPLMEGTVSLLPLPHLDAAATAAAVTGGVLGVKLPAPDSPVEGAHEQRHLNPAHAPSPSVSSRRTSPAPESAALVPAAADAVAAVNSAARLLPRREGGVLAYLSRLVRRIASLGRIGFYTGAFGGLLAALNVMQASGLLLYRAWHRPTVAAINSKALAACWGYIQHMMEGRNRAPVTFSGDVLEIPYNTQRVMPWNQTPDHPEPPSAYVIANHVFFCDFTLEHTVAVRRNMLGHCRYFAKESHGYWPLFGWLIRMAGFVLLKRDWDLDQRYILSRVQEWQRERQPIWMVAYPEGTRMTAEKFRKAQQFSRDRGLPVFNHLLCPRTKGFVAIMKMLRTPDSHFQYLLDFTVAARHLPTGGFNTVFPTGFDLLGRRRLDRIWQFHVHVDKFDLSDLPDDEAGLEQWLMDRWVAKDQRLAQWKAEWPTVANGGAFEIPYHTPAEVLRTMTTPVPPAQIEEVE
ncbi:hypothetical protein AMAG_10270 [Allomyces macrogynus ATCC 38327]|uniref:Phospholipid/glycerol acyltransferase domain-containing protein n=1 Tax=Allomyces macrogynus (strain ATCC 38327) TaxID=578462 RepID=A0A0L0SU63_ALLM3|nr:hypothetical protein AMAG_10270 [Allomyces macrogynus ATCC 38327]|eukprot:KNE65991.1 hypothetical protein AMAG_10270 [Allomyces macrogynus ATCC 38327]